MITDEQIEIVSKALSVSYADDDARIRKALEAYEQSKPKPEPYIYFKPDPFGWMVCAKDDDGAIALYEAPPTQEPLSDEFISSEMSNDEPEDWNDLNYKKSWKQGYELGFRRAEQAHGIGVTND